jgi:hypothetical protein
MELVIPEPEMPTDGGTSVKRALSYPIEIAMILAASPSMVEAPPPPPADGSHRRDRQPGGHASRPPRHSLSPAGGGSNRRDNALQRSVYARLGGPTSTTSHVVAVGLDARPEELQWAAQDNSGASGPVSAFFSLEHVEELHIIILRRRKGGKEP